MNHRGYTALDSIVTSRCPLEGDDDGLDGDVGARALGGAGAVAHRQLDEGGGWPERDVAGLGECVVHAGPSRGGATGGAQLAPALGVAAGLAVRQGEVGAGGAGEYHRAGGAQLACTAVGLGHQLHAQDGGGAEVGHHLVRHGHVGQHGVGLELVGAFVRDGDIGLALVGAFGRALVQGEVHLETVHQAVRRDVVVAVRQGIRAVVGHRDLPAAGAVHRRAVLAAGAAHQG